MAVSITPFKYKHYAALIEMLTSNQADFVKFLDYKTLPKMGYIALLNDQPVAAGFLRRVEGGYGQLDTFASNPYFGSKIRHEGLTLVAETLLADAKDLKLKGLLLITKDPGILHRAQAKGFTVINQILMGTSY